MFENLSAEQTIYWGAAVVSSVFFVLQTVAMLIGIGGDSADASGVDADTGLGEGGVGSEAMQMFTVRNFVNFLLGFGWGGVCLGRYIASSALLAVVSVLVGLAFVAIFVFIFRQMMRLEHSGNVDMERDVVGSEADVYLKIPSGQRGKVQLSVNGSIREYEAVAEDPSATLPTGTRVRIIAALGGNAVKVAPV